MVSDTDLNNNCHSLYQSNALCKISFINHSSAFLQSNVNCKEFSRKNTGKCKFFKNNHFRYFHYAVMAIHFLVVYSNNTFLNVLVIFWMCRTCMCMYICIFISICTHEWMHTMNSYGFKVLGRVEWLLVRRIF